jgi:glycosyltransferase involved in cell wall biosynthesis
VTTARAPAEPTRSEALRAVAVFHVAGMSGPHRSLLNAMTWLREQGAVEFVWPEKGPASRDYAALGSIAVVPYSRLTYARRPAAVAKVAIRFVRDLRRFRRQFRRSRPDLVVVVTTVLPAVLLAARLEGIPAVVYAAELYDQSWKRAGLLRVWGGLLARFTAALSDGIVSCSQAVARQFPSRNGVPHEIAYPPIGPEYARGDRRRARNRYGLAEGDVCLLVVGNVSRGRGQDVAIRALPLVRRSTPTARLLIAGSPHREEADEAFAEELRQLAAERHVVAAVSFVGDVEDMADLYAAADLVVNPARFAEPFGRVGPEALIAGKPVVATKVGAIPEALRDGIDGLLVPPDDAFALATAAVRILENDELSRTLASNGRERVQTKFGSDQDLAAWTGVLKGVFDRHGLAGVRSISGTRPRAKG